MSGLEGIAGLAISAAGITALFTTCIDAFDIVVTAREFGQEYEVLCADIALQRLRFCLWGEAVGLVSRDPARPPVRLMGLDDPEIKPTIIQTLQAIRFLLKESDRLQDRFSTETRSSRGLNLFRNTFSQFAQRADRNRKQASVAAVTKWAIYAKDKFESRIERLKSLIDGLEKVSESLGVLEQQRSRMQIEIESLSDVESLRLVRDASMQSQRDLSDTASHRLLAIETASAEKQASTSSMSQTFYTAEENETYSDRTSTWSDAPEASIQSNIAQNTRILANVANNATRPRCWTTNTKTDIYGAKLAAFDIEDMACLGHFPEKLSYVRKELLNLSPGQRLWDKDVTMSKSRYYTNFHGYDHLKRPAGKRLVKELSLVHRRGNIPGIACFPVSFDLLHHLAGIEGPPDTPYEDGVFWIDIHLRPTYPIEPPVLRFLTRIYHPNIDSRGKICINLLAISKEGWSPQYHLTTVLVSLCSILDDPGLTDPLVPEIAETYCKDYDLYCQNARTYTARYASAEPPKKENIA